MKKWILCIVVLLSFCSCSKDNDGGVNGYSTEVKKVLDVLKGEWEKEGKNFPETLSFTPFGEDKAVSGPAGGVMYFNGRARRNFFYVDGSEQVWDMYFYVNTEKKEISMYGVEDDEKFSVTQTKFYEYDIVDNNTIRLHDKSLSRMHEYYYRRVK